MARRGRARNGKGTIVARKDKNGRVAGYLGALRYIDKAGEPQRAYVSGTTEDEVDAKLDDVIRRLQDEAPVKDSKARLGDFLAEWIEVELEASDRARSTKDLYAFMLRKHVPVDSKPGSMGLGELRPADFTKLYLAMQKAGYAGSTLRSLHATLRAALQAAVDEHELVKANVMLKVARPGAGKTKPATFLTAEQSQDLLRVLAEHYPRMELLAHFLLMTGMRRGEALGLSWDDVDLDARTVRISTSLGRTSDGLELGPVKTRAAARTLNVSPQVVEVLRRRHAQQAAEKLAAPVGTWTDSGLIFTSELGGPWEPRNASRQFDLGCKKAGLTGVGLHTLRHSAASFLLAANVHMKVVQVYLGHSTFEVTADIYSHVAAPQASAAGDALGRALGA